MKRPRLYYAWRLLADSRPSTRPSVNDLFLFAALVQKDQIKSTDPGLPLLEGEKQAAKRLCKAGLITYDPSIAKEQRVYVLTEKGYVMLEALLGVFWLEYNRGGNRRDQAREGRAEP